MSDAAKHDIGHTTALVVDRRVVLSALGAASAVSLLPVSAVTAASLIPSDSARLLADWHIDDQWGPRYAESIACRGSTAGDAVADGLTAL
jgi:hypothetical protein